jgi:hypothetical protein
MVGGGAPPARVGRPIARVDLRRLRALRYDSLTMRRLLGSLATGLTMLLVFAPAALADNDGRGFYGATNDKVVTEAGLILVVFFPTFILLMSLLQWRLEKRKDARKAAQRSRAGDARWRGGW